MPLFKREKDVDTKELKQVVKAAGQGSCLTEQTLPELSEAQAAELYKSALNHMQAANTEAEYNETASMFQAISGFEDSDILAGQCLEKAEICRKDSIYFAAQSKMSGPKISKYKAALKLFESISGWRDADEQIRACQKKIKDLKAKKAADRLEKKRRKDEERVLSEQRAKRKKRKLCIAALVFLCIMLTGALVLFFLSVQQYNRAMLLIKSGEFDVAYGLLEKIGKNDAIAQSKYERALKLIDSGDYEAAYPLLHNNNYQDSAKKFEELMPQYYKKIFSNAETGSQLFFGAYEQDNDTSNGKEPIEWIVLEKENSENIFVVSKYALDCQCYNTVSSNVTWATCSLRKWLNSVFLSSAFSASEQRMIKSTIVQADRNPLYNTNPGLHTIDKIFSLSIAEVEKYYSSDNERKCKPTPYAVSRGTLKDVDNGCCFFWLRSPGQHANDASYVNRDGLILFGGNMVCNVDGSVRPALHITIK